MIPMSRQQDHLIDDPNVQAAGVPEEDNNDDPPDYIRIDQGDVYSDED